jgi:carbon-monoxide dehydrogenase large subunit
VNTQSDTPLPGAGESLPRVEDDHLLRGQGRFVGSLHLPGMAHAVILRSMYARARLHAVDTSAAQKMPGVLGVFTSDDLLAAGVSPIGFHAAVPAESGGEMSAPPRHALARNELRHVGEPVALVVATSRYAALDAAERIEVKAEPLPAVSGLPQTLDPNAPQLWPGAPGNIVGRYEYGDTQAVADAMQSAAHVVRLRVVNQRVAPTAMEPRGAVGVWHANQQRFTLHTASQTPHLTRQLLAPVLGVPESAIRVKVGDIGGGFGSKVSISPEDVLVLFAARALGCPVRWVADRSESFLSDMHGRDHLSECELALDAEGRFLALKVRDWADMGAYISFFGAAIATRTGNRVANGAYHIPFIHAEIRAVLSNTPPTGPYRGAGRPETVYRLERLIDVAARRMAMDPAELRRRNLIRPDQIPYTNVVGQTYDSGRFPAVLDQAMTRADWHGFQGRRDSARARGRLRGRGIAYHIDSTSGITPSETATLSLEASTVTVLSGTQAMGQGLETAYTQLVAANLRVSPERVRIIQGDTDRVSSGVGSYGSRSLYIGGAAIVMAAHALLKQLGLASPPGLDQIFEIAETMGKSGCSVAATATSPFCFPNGCHICEVEIDTATGEVSVERYTAVDDVGTVIHPVIVEGQTWGAVVQGLGQALLEHVVHDPDSAQLLTGSLMDYALPRATLLPAMDTLLDQQAPSTTGLLGAKGAGEGGALGAPPAAVSAVMDALSEFGTEHLDMPLLPERIWRIIQSKHQQEEPCTTSHAAVR